MNTKERFIAALEHRPTDRLPVTTHHIMPSFLNTYLNGASNSEFFNQFGLDAIDWQMAYKFDSSKKEYYDPEHTEMGFLEARRILSDNWIIKLEKLNGYDCSAQHFNIVTPEKTLSMILQSNEHTTWVKEHLIKDKKDIDIIAKYMTYPLSDVGQINKKDEELGDSALLRGHIMAFEGFGQPGCWQDASCLFGIEPLIMATFEGSDEYFKKTIAHLGIKPYISDIVPSKAVFDTDFLDGFPSEDSINLAPEGVFCVTSDEKLTPESYFGSITPQRYPILRNYVVAKGTDSFGEILNSSVIFTQNWQNHSRMVVIASNTEKSLVHPQNPYFDRLIASAVKHCLNKIFISTVESNYACYYKGEPVKITYHIHNFHEAKKQITAEIQISDKNEIIKKIEHVIEIPARAKQNGTVYWNIPDRPSDYYEIKVKIKTGNNILSKANNGFVVWNEEVVKKAPAIGIKDKNFLINGKPALLTGTNYYESILGDLMWIKPNVMKLHDDFKTMADAGINFLRIHYHHAKWYTDYFNTKYGFVPEYFENTNPGYIPDEKTWRILDAHIYLCQKYGIIYGGDLFTLIPEEMGESRGWMGGLQDRILLREKIEHQKEFLRLLSERYKDVPAISWDLWNEPDVQLKDKFGEWGREMRTLMRKTGDNHPITIGEWDPFTSKSFVDYYSSHGRYDESSRAFTPGTIPNMFQEVWMDTFTNYEGDSLQSCHMKQALFESFSIGFAGFAPWQWTGQAKMRNDFMADPAENWDDKLGSSVRWDGTIKPAGRYYKQFAWLVRNLPFYDCENKVAKTEKGTVKFNDFNLQKRGTYIMEYLNGENLSAGIAIGLVQANNKVYIETNNDEEIWFYATGNKGIQSPNKLYLKTNNAAQLKCYFEKSPVKAVLCNAPKQDEITNINFTIDNGISTFEIKKWQTNYWIELSWE